MHISDLDTPALLIDLEVMERNLRAADAQARGHGCRMRPHMKTHKMPEIGRMQVEYGAVGLCCAKVGEMEVMAGGGIDDLMLCYPVWGEEKLRRLACVAERARVSVAFDSFEVAECLSRMAAETGVAFGALVETDTGTRRCGVPAGEPLVELCRRVRDLTGVQFRGIMTYQGYVLGTRAERERQLREENGRINRMLDDLAGAGIECDIVSGASTPNLFLSHLLERVTENRCGTYVFNDRNTVHTGDITWDDCALRVAVTVVSTAVPGQIIIDSGSKTFSGDGWAGGDGYGRVVEDPSLDFARMNEEHGYLRLGDGGRRYRIGDRLHVIPNHACTTVNMHDQVWVHRDGEVVDCWRVAARGKLR